MAQSYTEISDGGWVSGMNISRPVFVDLDNDSLLDMMVATWDGTIHHFEQDEPGSITFILISETFNDIHLRSFGALCVRDIDNDELLDLIIGEDYGTLYHYEQEVAGSGTFTYVTDNFNGIDVGAYSAPCFTDLDQDGFLDLIIGEDNGSLFHYEQDTTDLNVFTFVSDSLKGITVERNSVPFFIDIDNDSLLDLIIGERYGNLYHYRQDATGGDSFIQISDNFNEINVGGWSAPFFTDLDNDGMLDLIIGETNGNFHHYEQHALGSTVFDSLSSTFIKGLLDFGQYSAPFFTDLDNNGLLDMIIGEYDGILSHYQQVEPGSNYFSLVSDTFNNINVGIFSTLFFIDLDTDELLDLIVGEWDGNLNHYEQDEINSTNFSLITENFNDIDVGSGATPHFTDLDNDSLLDMIVGELDGNLNHYEQDETGSYSFTLITDSLSDIDIGRRSAPCFTDLDNNNLLDLIVGESSLNLNHYEQDEVGGGTFTLKTEQFMGISIDAGSRPVFADINNDGLEDLIFGNINGGIRYFQRNNETVIKSDQVNLYSFKIFPNYPNPFNPSTMINYQLSMTSDVELSIYNLLGQKVATLVSARQPAGSYKIQWDAAGYASGVYYYQLRAGEFQSVRKMILLR